MSSTKPYKGAKPYTIQWTLKDSKAAQKQGWDLFDAGERFEIEVNTEHPAGFDEGDDDAAVAWIIQQALRGNKTCIKGLLIAGLLDPQRFASDLTHAVKTKRITVMDTKKKASKPYSTVEYRSDAPPKPKTRWEDDFTQFARLVAEFNAAGAPNQEQLEAMMESMDLTVEDIHELMDRAEAAWFKIKEELR